MSSTSGSQKGNPLKHPSKAASLRRIILLSILNIMMYLLCTTVVSAWVPKLLLVSAFLIGCIFLLRAINNLATREINKTTSFKKSLVIPKHEIYKNARHVTNPQEFQASLNGMQMLQTPNGFYIDEGEPRNAHVEQYPWGIAVTVNSHEEFYSDSPSTGAMSNLFNFIKLLVESLFNYLAKASGTSISRESMLGLTNEGTIKRLSDTFNTLLRRSLKTDQDLIWISYQDGALVINPTWTLDNNHKTERYGVLDGVATAIGQMMESCQQHGYSLNDFVRSGKEEKAVSRLLFETYKNTLPNPLNL